MLKLEDSMTNKIETKFEYIDKDEASVLLGMLRNMECEHCPDFYKGCIGSYTKQEIVSMPIRKYLEQQKEGTEKYLCGKLRNIYLINEAQNKELEESYSKSVNNQIGFLLKYDKIRVDTLDSNERIKKIEEEANIKINQIVIQANKKIEEMQNVIETLQKRLSITESQLTQILNTNSIKIK
jgi:hypothetical protein